jgi:hypothetical protein
MQWWDQPVRTLCVAIIALGLAGCMKDFEVPGRDTPEGATYVRRCSLCHALPDPSRMTFAQWVPVVERMTRNIRAQNVPQISDEEVDTILTYLRRYARDAKRPSGDAKRPSGDAKRPSGDAKRSGDANPS